MSASGFPRSTQKLSKIDPQVLTQASPGQSRSMFWSRIWSNKTTEATAFTATPKGARANPLLLTFPLLFLLLCLTKFLTQELAWAGLGQTLGSPRSSSGLGQGQTLGKLAQKFGRPIGRPGDRPIGRPGERPIGRHIKSEALVLYGTIQ